MLIKSWIINYALIFKNEKVLFLREKIFDVRLGEDIENWNA